MNELITTNNFKITSLDIAEITGKQHKNILADIRQELEKIKDIAGLIFQPSEYKDTTGRTLPCYEFGKKGAMQLALKYDAVTRYKVIEKIEELENQNKLKIPNFNNPAESARAWADQFEQAEKQKQINLQNKPKVEFYDTVTQSKDTVDIGTAAKVLNKGIGRNKLFEMLRNEKVLQQNNQPYQKYIDCGYFRQVESKFSKPDGTNCINIKTVVYQKGLDFISKLIDKNEN